MQVKVARIGKPHGIKGEVTLQLHTDAPETRLVPGAALDVEPATPLAPNGRLTVAAARWNKSILVVKFAEAASRNDAETLRNHVLSIDADEAEETEGYYEHDLVGLDVYSIPTPETEDLGEPIGTVAGLQTLPTQDLLTVTLADGEEALVPFVEEIVPEVDLEEGFVVICPPAGLLEINASSEAQEDSSAEARRGEEEGPQA